MKKSGPGPPPAQPTSPRSMSFGPFCVTVFAGTRPRRTPCRRNPGCRARKQRSISRDPSSPRTVRAHARVSIMCTLPSDAHLAPIANRATHLCPIKLALRAHVMLSGQSGGHAAQVVDAREAPIRHQAQYDVTVSGAQCDCRYRYIDSWQRASRIDPVLVQRAAFPWNALALRAHTHVARVRACLRLLEPALPSTPRRLPAEHPYVAAAMCRAACTALAGIGSGRRGTGARARLHHGAVELHVRP